MILKEGIYSFEDKKDMANYLEISLFDQDMDNILPARLDAIARVANALNNKEIEEWAKIEADYSFKHFKYEIPQANIEQKLNDLGFYIKNNKVKLLHKKKPSFISTLFYQIQRLAYLSTN
jgi:hypothetical protein